MEKYQVKKGASPLLVAHRGICTANIPCNTLASFGIALDQGADVVEIDVSVSKDGKHFVFHPGMEPVYLKCGKYINEMEAKEVEELFLLNQDEAPTHYKVPYLADVLALLKDKAYINVDKFWTDVPGITEAIRRAGVESQVIVKTGVEEESLLRVEKYAPDFMFMPLVRKTDTVTATMKERNINFIGTTFQIANTDGRQFFNIREGGSNTNDKALGAVRNARNRAE